MRSPTIKNELGETPRDHVSTYPRHPSKNIRIQSGVALSKALRSVYFTLAGPTEGHSHIGPTPIDAACVAAAAPVGTTQSRRLDPRPTALLSLRRLHILTSIKDADCDPVVGLRALSLLVGVAPGDLGSAAMTVATQIVFHSLAELERPGREHYQDLPIIIVLIILFGALSVLLGLCEAPVQPLISAL
jgi:hypothetical protein